jgi:hypothetical protein
MNALGVPEVDDGCGLRLVSSSSSSLSSRPGTRALLPAAAGLAGADATGLDDAPNAETNPPNSKSSSEDLLAGAAGFADPKRPVVG